MNIKPRFVILCGPSGSGKSTLARALRQLFGDHRCAVLPTDHYYHDLSQLKPDERILHNFDCLEAIDQQRLVRDMTKLADGKTIIVPKYDFVTHTRSEQGVEFEPKQFILIEGIFAQALLCDLNLPAFVIYLDVPVDVCLKRRVIRDQVERGRSKEEIEIRFRKDILPSIQELVIPQRTHADLVLDATKPLEELCEQILKAF